MGATDPADGVIETIAAAMLWAFNPASNPDGGGSTSVRFFAGDAPPLAAWDAHAQGTDCKQPFLWVRAMRRYLSVDFPSPTVDTPCLDVALQVIAVEIGVGRCAVVDLEPDWDDYAQEAAVSLDDSWRIQGALCRAAGLLKPKRVALDTVTPYGPEGGVIAWTAVAYVQL